MKKIFLILFKVVVIGGVIFSMFFLIYNNKFWSMKGNYDIKDYNTAIAMLNACAEISLLEIKERNDFVGSGSHNVDKYNCEYVITSPGGDNRNIIVKTTIGLITKKIEIITKGFKPIEVISWKEML